VSPRAKTRPAIPGTDTRAKASAGTGKGADGKDDDLKSDFGRAANQADYAVDQQDLSGRIDRNLPGAGGSKTNH